ncbi:thioredoxin reductase [Micromonospora peucetia]|uniref:thioredoxin reductase n=1 Tax=Micromonospora peucetia TaxID=47871 RepID=UPI00332C59B0
MRDLRHKMIKALDVVDLGDPIRAQAAEICAEIAEQHCRDLGHAAQPRAGEIGELSTEDPPPTWTPPGTAQRAW